MSIQRAIGEYLQSIRTAYPALDLRSAWNEFYRGIQRLLFPYMRSDAQQWATAYFEAFLAQPAIMHFIPALRHGDFGGSNTFTILPHAVLAALSILIALGLAIRPPMLLHCRVMAMISSHYV